MCFRCAGYPRHYRTCGGGEARGEGLEQHLIATSCAALVRKPRVAVRTDGRVALDCMYSAGSGERRALYVRLLTVGCKLLLT